VLLGAGCSCAPGLPGIPAPCVVATEDDSPEVGGGYMLAYAGMAHVCVRAAGMLRAWLG